MAKKEKTQIGISEEILKDMRKWAAERDRWEEEQKQKTPEAPDGSGEIGRYDEDASKWFGGEYIYKTESGRYFGDTGEGYDFVDSLHLESYLISLKRRRTQQKK